MVFEIPYDTKAKYPLFFSSFLITTIFSRYHKGKVSEGYRCQGIGVREANY